MLHFLIWDPKLGRYTLFSNTWEFCHTNFVGSDVIASPNFLEYFNTTSTSSIIGAINSTFNGGAVFGSLMGGLTMDRFGRRMTIQIGALICLVGAILQASAVSLAMILLGRIFAGWAVGLLSMAVPVYQSECAHPKVREKITARKEKWKEGFWSWLPSFIDPRSDCRHGSTNDRCWIHRVSATSFFPHSLDPNLCL